MERTHLAQQRTSATVESYEYLTKSPNGPTINNKFSQYNTTESSPHHTKSSGGRRDPESNSDRFLVKSVDRTRSKPVAVKHAMY